MMSLRSLRLSFTTIGLYWIFFTPDSQPGLITLGKLQCSIYYLCQNFCNILIFCSFSAKMPANPGSGSGLARSGYGLVMAQSLALALPSPGRSRWLWPGPGSGLALALPNPGHGYSMALAWLSRSGWAKACPQARAKVWLEAWAKAWARVTACAKAWATA